jgi:DNA mismatch repair protein MutS2
MGRPGGALPWRWPAGWGSTAKLSRPRGRTCRRARRSWPNTSPRWTREREALGEADSRARSKEEALRQREETFKQKLNEKLDQRLREARIEIDHVVSALRKQVASLAEQAGRRAAEALPSTGDTGRLRGEARAAVDALVDRFRQQDAPAQVAEPNTRPAVVGDRVSIASLGLEGTVVLVHDRDAEVEVRGKRFRAHTGELRVIEAPARAERPSVQVNVQLQPREGMSSSELLLVGNTVDQAIDRLEKFLDESLLTEQRTIRLIHGFGTGRLKEAVFEYLHNHPLVTHVRTASPEEGGGGVTIAELKD